MNEHSAILIRNIFHMLCYAFRILRQRNYEHIATENFRHVEDMLAAILSRGIAQQLKQGLYRTYGQLSFRLPLHIYMAKIIDFGNT